MNGQGWLLEEMLSCDYEFFFFFFQTLNEAILDFFGKALGEAWTPEAQAAWAKLLATMTSKIAEGLTSAD